MIKKDLFTFNGETSSDHGLMLEEADIFPAPVRKRTVLTIPGRSEKVIQDGGCWENVSLKYTVSLRRDLPERWMDVLTWLSMPEGYCRLENSIQPEHFRLAYYEGGIDVKQLRTFKAARTNITFKARAELFLKDGEIPITITKGSASSVTSILLNPTAYEAMPLIKVMGTGSGTLTIQGQTMNITDLVDYVYIDSEQQDVYRLPSENRNSLASGVFPKLLPGDNSITISGFTSVEIIPRFYTL